MNEQRIREIIREELAITQANFNMNRNLKMSDGSDIITGRTQGTRFGTEVTQKLAFFGSTPVVKQPTVPPAVDLATAQTAINTIITRLQTFGLIN
jgi:hypothetical protein